MNEGNGNSGSSVDELSGELLQFCLSDSLSEEGLRKIIDKYELTPDHNRHGDYNFGNAFFFFAACDNERVTEEIIRLLIEYFPDAPSKIDTAGLMPLHYACCNNNMTANIIQLLIEAAPDSVRHAHKDGELPIHFLCGCLSDGLSDGNEAAKVAILKLLLDKYPESIRLTNNKGFLPLHYALHERNLLNFVSY